MRHSSSGRGTGSFRSFHDKTRWSSAGSTYRERNSAKTLYAQVGSTGNDSRNFYPKRNQGATRGTRVERKEEISKTEKPLGNRNYRNPNVMTTRDGYNIANYHFKKEHNPHLVKVWVRNLPPSYSEDDFHTAFESAGRSFSSVVWCQFYPGCPASRKETLSSARKGFAYLAFQSLEDALEFEKEFNGIKLKDTNNSVDYGIRIFRSLFPKVPSKFRYRDPSVATIFDDVDFLAFQRAINNESQEEEEEEVEEQSKQNLNAHMTSDKGNSPDNHSSSESTEVHDKQQPLATNCTTFDKSVDSCERDSTYSNDKRNTNVGNLPTKQRYSKQSTHNFASSQRWTPRYRVKRKTEQGQE